MEHSPQLDTTISMIFQETEDKLRILRVSSLSSATGLMRGIVFLKKEVNSGKSRDAGIDLGKIEPKVQWYGNPNDE